MHSKIPSTKRTRRDAAYTTIIRIIRFINIVIVTHRFVRVAYFRVTISIVHCCFPHETVFNDYIVVVIIIPLVAIPYRLRRVLFIF